MSRSCLPHIATSFIQAEKCDENVMIAVCFVMVSCVPCVTLFLSSYNCVMANTLFTLAMRMEIEPHGFLGLAAPLLRRRTQPLFERNLANIKARLERAERGSPLTSLKGEQQCRR
jgi:hypothetical protein